MKKLILILITVIMLMAVTAAAEEMDFDDSSVIVVMNVGAEQSVTLYSNPFEGLGIAETECIFSETKKGISLFNTDDTIQIFKLTLENPGKDNVLEMVDKLNELPQVKSAEPNYILQLFSTVNDTYYESGKQQALSLIGAEQVWDLDIDCSNVTVGVIDSGIELTHEDLKDNLWMNPNEIPGDGVDNDGNGYIDDVNGWDFADGDNDPTYSVVHGVHVSGIVSAVTNNGKGVASVARNAKLAALKIFNSSGSSYDSIIKAINYAKDKNITILNNSWGGTTEPKAVEEAIKASPDILYVFAAGNVTDGASEPDNDKTPVYPASYSKTYDNVISVANTTVNDVLASSSHYGKTTVDIAAPGSSIYSTYPISTYNTMTGTSMACPMVTSVAAVMKAVNPDITPAEIKEIIMSSSDKIDALVDKTVSGGRINAYAAVSEIIGTMPTPEPMPSGGSFKYNIAIEIKDGAAQITVSGISDNEEQCDKLIIADYDEYGTLVNVSVEDVRAEVSHLLSDTNIHTVKAFIWDTLEQMNPLSECAEKDIQE
ncbi:MAG: S8 family peptidase [Hominilimicola sp.]